MAARITIERILRDADDASGQSIRQWKVEAEIGGITVRHNHGDGFIMMRTDDVDRFVADIYRAATIAKMLKEESDAGK